jgi:hypothetical protein
MKTKLGVVQSSKTLKFIAEIEVSIATRNNTSINDPKANVYFKATAQCLEYEQGHLVGAQPRNRALIINLEKKCFIWEYTLGEYKAENSDEMFEKALKLIEDLNK